MEFELEEFLSYLKLLKMKNLEEIAERFKNAEDWEKEMAFPLIQHFNQFFAKQLELIKAQQEKAKEIIDNLIKKWEKEKESEKEDETKE